MRKHAWYTWLVGMLMTLFAGSAWAQIPDQRPDHQCGPAFGNAKCGENRCCSRFNWCGGLEEQHCSSARGYNGRFDGPRSLPDQRPDHQCGPAFGSAKCGTDRCCSQFNWCGGLNEQHCSSARGYNGQFDGPRSAAPIPAPIPAPLPAPLPPQDPTADQRPDHQCGPAFGNAKCGVNRCCSQFNWCGGLNEQHCTSARGYGGQFDGPRSAAPAIPVPPPAPPPAADTTGDQRPDHQCGPAFGNAKCGDNRCCSRFNWCGGLNEQHCTSARGYGGRFDGPRSVPDQRPDHQCGPAFGNAKCGTNRCCSQFNWCGGPTEQHCTSARGYGGRFDGPRQ